MVVGSIGKATQAPPSPRALAPAPRLNMLRLPPCCAKTWATKKEKIKNKDKTEIFNRRDICLFNNRYFSYSFVTTTGRYYCQINPI